MTEGSASLFSPLRIADQYARSGTMRRQMKHAQRSVNISLERRISGECCDTARAKGQITQDIGPIRDQERYS